MNVNKPIIKICLVFIFLNLIPLCWNSQIEFNLAAFTTEYYKFLYNIFIVGLIALFFKSQTESISKSLEKKKDEEFLKQQIQLFLIAVSKKNIDDSKAYWQIIYEKKHKLNQSIEFEKINTYIQNTSSLNLQNFDSKEFNSLITKLRDETN